MYSTGGYSWTEHPYVLPVGYTSAFGCIPRGVRWCIPRGVRTVFPVEYGILFFAEAGEVYWSL